MALLNVSQAIKQRASVRAFLSKSVDDKTIYTLLETARWAASGKNTQPWYVAVVRGKTRHKIQHALLTAHQSGQTPQPEDEYYPDHYPAAQKKRAFACGMALYHALNIQREDKQKRMIAWQRNYQCFDAPVALFFFMDKNLAKGSWLDLGMFLQNVMLAALDHGLDTCPQAALAEYPQQVKAILGETYHDKTLICGMSLGYADKTAPVNNYRTERENVEQFAQWFD